MSKIKTKIEQPTEEYLGIVKLPRSGGPFICDGEIHGLRGNRMNIFRFVGCPACKSKNNDLYWDIDRSHSEKDVYLLDCDDCSKKYCLDVIDDFKYDDFLTAHNIKSRKSIYKVIESYKEYYNHLDKNCPECLQAKHRREEVKDE